MITVVMQHNPFAGSTASANRWLTLLEGLAMEDMNINILFCNGYTNLAEKQAWDTEGVYRNMKYRYLSSRIADGYIKPRFDFYFGDFFANQIIKQKIIPALDSSTKVLWTDTSVLGFKLAVALKKRSFPVKTFLEMNEFLDIHKYNNSTYWQQIIFHYRQQFFEKRAFHAYDGMALMTKTLQQYFSQFPEPRPNFLHLPMTVDLERFSTETPPIKEFVQPYIAFVGVMNDAKDGVSILIKAFAQIHHQYPNHKLYLVGPWNYDTPIHQKIIAELNLEHKVFWMGEYNRNQIPAILKNAELLVLPRPNSKQAQGGFPTKLGEYLATGNPVCATRVGELPDYLNDGESVFFADPGSVDSLANAMYRALANPSLAKCIGKNGLKIAQTHFNKNIQAKQLAAFLQNLIHY